MNTVTCIHAYTCTLLSLFHTHTHTHIHGSLDLQDSKPLGTIPLKNLTVTALDDSPMLPPNSVNDTLPGRTGCVSVKTRKSSVPRVNRILLITANGVRYELQAVNPDDREMWISQLKIASKLL